MRDRGREGRREGGEEGGRGKRSQRVYEGCQGGERGLQGDGVSGASLRVQAGGELSQTGPCVQWQAKRNEYYSASVDVSECLHQLRWCVRQAVPASRL